MKRNFIEYLSSLKISIFLNFLIVPIILETQNNIINNIIIIENTNGDIYLNEQNAELIFGSTFSKGEERIFYILSNNKEKKYFINDDGDKVPFIKKKIQNSEKIQNPEIIFFVSDNEYIVLLFGSNNSNIEAIYLDSDFEESISPSDFFCPDRINRGIPSILDISSIFYYISPATLENNTSNYFISFHKYAFFSSNKQFNSFQIYNTTFNANLKQGYISCFYNNLVLIDFISCLYLDIDNSYKISVYPKQSEDEEFKENLIFPIEQISNPSEDKTYFLKAVNKYQGNGIYFYYSGENNDIPTILIKSFSIGEYNLKNKYTKFPYIKLNDFSFNNGIQYNDLFLKGESGPFLDLYFISTELGNENLIIADIVFYQSSTTNEVELIIRYYKLELKKYFNMKIFHGFKSFNYDLVNNGYTTLAIDFCLLNECNDLNEKKSNLALIIFNYLNVTVDDIEVDFIDYAFENNKKYVIVNLKKFCKIENNIFNYDCSFFLDILIDYYENEREGIKFYYKENEEIDTLYIKGNDSIIRIDLTNYTFEVPIDEINLNYHIEINKLNLDEFNNKWNYINTTYGNKNDEQSYGISNKKSFPLFYNIIINKPLNTSCNDSNCTLCLQEDINYCIVCKDDKYTILDDEKYGKIKLCWKEGLDLEDLLNGKYKDYILTNEDIRQIYEMLCKYLKEKYAGENIIIETSNVKIELSSLDAQTISKELSYIDLGECGKKLKEKYCKLDNDSLILLKFDIKLREEKSTYVKFDIYEPNYKSKINLNECGNLNIFIYSPMEFDSEIESKYSMLSNEGYNLFDNKDLFYNDNCATYTTENGTDILLYDRRMDIYQQTVNISLCQDDCDLEYYDLETKKGKCKCIAKDSEIENTDLSQLKFNKNEMIKEFKKILENSNFRVLKCFKLAFDIKAFTKNIGSVIMIILTTFFISLVVVYFLISSKKINSIIKLILEQKYKKNNNINKERELNKTDIKKKKKKKIRKRSVNPTKFIFNFNINSIKSPPKKSLISENLSISKDLINNIQNPNDTNNIKNNHLENKDILIYKKENEVKELNDVNNNNDVNIEKNKIYIPIEEKNKIKIKRNNVKNFTGKISDSKIYLGNKKVKKVKIKETEIKDLNNEEINSLEYEKAIHLDKRTYFQYYISLIKKKQLIIFAFFPSNDYNLLSLKISLFILSFSLYFTINGFFFNDDTMHKIYKDNGSFNVLYQLPRIVYSSIVSTVINSILRFLSLSENDILEIKKEKNMEIINKKAKKVERYLKIKFLLFFIFGLLLMFFFWYFISCFCAVYKNTQKILFNNTLISFCISMLYPFGINLIPGILRIPALRSENKDKKCLYIISQYAALL